MKRLHQMVLIGAFLGFSWLAMQAVHELGHVVGAIVTGGKVTKVVLHPFTISRTDVFPNPHPLIEVWAGPVAGVILPLLAYLCAQVLRSPGIYLFRFFAGFCAVANGVYVGAGWLAQGGADGVVMLAYGAARWQLVVFGLLAIPLGLYLWNGLGPHFGLGDNAGKVNRSAAATSAILFVAIAGIEIAMGSR